MDTDFRVVHFHVVDHVSRGAVVVRPYLEAMHFEAAAAAGIADEARRVGLFPSQGRELIEKPELG